jgi:hypothetical protein
MTENSLAACAEGIRSDWGPLTSELIAKCKSHVEALVRTTPSTEKWLADLQRTLPETEELIRDPVRGFLLLAHAELSGHYRTPHDHGRGWVIYVVQRGEMEIATYARTQDANGNVRLVRRETYRVHPGRARVYLPGDIHDTRCTSNSILYYRLADRDLKKDEQEGHPMTRYVERDGFWTTGAA